MLTSLLCDKPNLGSSSSMSPRCCVVTCLCSLSTTLHCFSNCPRAKWASCLKQSSSTNSEQRLVCHLAVKPVADTLSKRDLFSLFHTLIYPYFLNTIQKRSSQGTEQLTPLCASVVNVSLSRRRPPRHLQLGSQVFLSLL